MKNKHVKWLLFLTVLTFGCAHVLKCDYFFSNQFTGEVAIIYGYDSGIDLTLKDGRQQYFIPDSGIILTKEKYQEGILEQNFYVKQDKNIYEVSPYSYQKDTTKNYIYFDRIETIECASTNNTTKGYFVKLFYVGKKMDSLSNKKRFFFENHIRKLFGCVE